MARRLLITYLSITALALAVVVIPLGGIFADRERDRLMFDIERDAQAVASLVEDALEAGGTPSIDPVLTDYAHGGGRIVVVDRDGISVADSDAVAGPRRDFSTRPEMIAALDGERSSGSRSSETLDADLVYVAIPVASGGTVHGAVRITFPTSTLDARVRSTWMRLGSLSAVVLIVVAGVGMMFARGVTRPVRRLEHAARRLADGDLSARVDTNDGPPELRALAQTFNATAQQLAQLVESQQRFVADASHQLRTPLTALRLRLETLAHGVPDEQRATLEAAIEETTRLGRLVQSLLVLARSDAAVAVCGPVDLTAVVDARVEAWSPVARDDGKSLASHLPATAWVQATPDALDQIVDNLVSNALDAAPAGTAATIDVRVGDRTTELHVIDRGSGIPEDDRERAFERFWQPGGEKGEGFGLGLAIVRQLATRCGGTAYLDAGPECVGLDAVVELRTVPAPTERTVTASTNRDLYRPLTKP